ncbi:MAG: hypothetical protein WCD45_06670, partial [Gallionella sp.]
VQYPNDLLRVDFEKLCEQPHNAMHEISQFMSIDPSDAAFVSYSDETLKPVAAKRPFPLHACIEKPFMETMQELGYI